MEARCKGLFVAVFGISTILTATLEGATDRSRNFIVTAPTPEMAKQIAKAAEVYRYKLALEWLGKPIPDWKAPCTVNVKVGQIGAGGATTFIFDRGNVSDYRMNIQGSLERILDSVLPHEINHTIFAEHFRRPMPRWADEGAATFVEDESERRRQMLLAMDVLKTPRRIPLKGLLSIMDYPRDMTDVLTLYAEGYVLTELLIQSGGRAKFLKFLQTAHTEGWDRAIHTHYGHGGIAVLDREWNQWVFAGCPAKEQGADETLLASAEATATPQKSGRSTARSQAPDREPVTVVDAAHNQMQLAGQIDQPTPRFGAGLQAPNPPRGGDSGFSEPAMLSQVELGSEVEFVPPRNQLVAGRSRTNPNRTAASPRRDREDAYASNEMPETSVDEATDDGREDRMVASRPDRPMRATSPATRRNTLVTPSLRLENKTQLGQSRLMTLDDL